MKKSTFLVFAMLMTATSIHAAETNNPFTGKTIKPVNNELLTSKIPATPNTVPPPPVPTGIPNMNNLQPSPMNYSGMPNTTPEMKKKYVDPLERYLIDGIVNENIIIKDQLNPDKIIYKNDMEMLSNGCVIKYPSILCGDAGLKAIKMYEDKNSISFRLMEEVKKNGKLKDANDQYQKAIYNYEQKFKDLDPKYKKLIDISSEIEKLRAEKKISDTKIADFTKGQESLAKIINDKNSIEKQYQESQIKNKELTEKVNKLIAEQALNNKTLNKIKTESKEALNDMNMIANILYESQFNTEYNVPQIGKFKGIKTNTLFYAFVSPEQSKKADEYFKKYNIRAYKTDKYVMYINDKKFLDN